MATKHTPGPWKQEGNNIVADYTATCGVVASVSAMPNKWETEANARLIAAAPELLEALRDVMGWYDTSDVAHLMTKQGEQAEYQRTLRAARAAIALAK